MRQEHSRNVQGSPRTKTDVGGAFLVNRTGRRRIGWEEGPAAEWPEVKVERLAGKIPKVLAARQDRGFEVFLFVCLFVLIILSIPGRLWRNLKGSTSHFLFSVF